MKKTMLVIAAHMGDFVWRSGGSIAKYAQEGHDVYVIVMSYGARGESKDYWKTPNANLEDCKKTRRREGEAAARILGVKQIIFYEYEDYPLSMDVARYERLATDIRRIRPDFILTHDREDDVFNPDHNLVSRSVMQAYQIASGAGAFCEGEPVSPRQTPMFGFEPHNTEICNFKPWIYIDITEYFEKKAEAMAVCQSQKGMAVHYKRKAELRAAQCAGRGNNAGCKYAEAFSSYGPIAAYGYFVW